MQRISEFLTIPLVGLGGLTGSIIATTPQAVTIYFYDTFAWNAFVAIIAIIVSVLSVIHLTLGIINKLHWRKNDRRYGEQRTRD